MILLRAPLGGVFSVAEPMGFPRDKFWDALVEACDCPAYNFEDHPSLQGYDLPEWSHMSPPEAKRFTKEFVKLLIRDGVLSPQ